MPDSDDLDLTAADLALEDELRKLAALTRRASRARAEIPDPAFVAALRARLVEPLPAAPRPSFQRRLRRRLEGRSSLPRWTFAAAGLGLAAAVAVVISVLLVPTANHARVASPVPRPARADLIRAYPVLNLHPPSGGGGGYTPIDSAFENSPGDAYPKRLRLRLQSFPPMRTTLPAYRLAVRPLKREAIVSAARRLGVRPSRPFCMSSAGTLVEPCGRNTWAVIEVAGWPSHSINVSWRGEIVYHDSPRHPAVYHGPRLRLDDALRIARCWLRILGRPASRMPVQAIHPAGFPGPINGRPVFVSFAWARGVHANIPAAEMWVAPTGHVIEAVAWPTIAHRATIEARGVADAWAQVGQGRAPIAVQGRLSSFPAGTGVATKVSLTQVLVAPKQGAVFLEPVYRFSGFVTLDRGEGRHRWYALVPATLGGS
jgi:hypothetical protein